ncbi:MAG: hypothetical protein BJ554DRAFT_4803 [Olpidium bornovanus]|uniref:Aminoacyl-transfer RNA synthetases class-II family profile domain-containing protein n=1 Tax=Olpidium bornovanus TaxID=278681 RepID=A0A8H8DEK9_9FUNG|nr:MAG: hypothetical protein BJ554DRAFT_4803 [Olpidium bornovanus]
MPSLLAPILALPPEVYVDVIIRCMRRFFDERGFLEVETPILTAMPGGAKARPFLTRSGGLEDHQWALRIAPELHLKVGSVMRRGRVYFAH